MVNNISKHYNFNVVRRLVLGLTHRSNFGLNGFLRAGRALTEDCSKSQGKLMARVLWFQERPNKSLYEG